MAPDFVAPGVNVKGVYPTGFGTMTGTSAAAAIAAGAVAILMEWGLVQGNMRAMDGDVVRLLLISGCKRDEGILYPNTRWGYGKLDLYGTFLKIKESSIIYDTSMGIQ
jgi:subtilisin family serine protease